MPWPGLDGDKRADVHGAGIELLGQVVHLRADNQRFTNRQARRVCANGEWSKQLDVGKIEAVRKPFGRRRIRPSDRFVRDVRELVVTGIASGMLIWSMATALGLGVLIEAVPTSLALLKLLGGGYLLFLGLQAARATIRHRRGDAGVRAFLALAGRRVCRGLWRDGGKSIVVRATRRRAVAGSGASVDQEQG